MQVKPPSFTYATTKYATYVLETLPYTSKIYTRNWQLYFTQIPENISVSLYIYRWLIEIIRITYNEVGILFLWSKFMPGEYIPQLIGFLIPFILRNSVKIHLLTSRRKMNKGRLISSALYPARSFAYRPSSMQRRESANFECIDKNTIFSRPSFITRSHRRLSLVSIREGILRKFRIDTYFIIAFPKTLKSVTSPRMSEGNCTSQLNDVIQRLPQTEHNESIPWLSLLIP